MPCLNGGAGGLECDMLDSGARDCGMLAGQAFACAMRGYLVLSTLHVFQYDIVVKDPHMEVQYLHYSC